MSAVYEVKVALSTLLRTKLKQNFLKIAEVGWGCSTIKGQGSEDFFYEDGMDGTYFMEGSGHYEDRCGV